MNGAGILHNDILVVDRSQEARGGEVVIAVVEGELTVKRVAHWNPGAGNSLASMGKKKTPWPYSLPLRNFKRREPGAAKNLGGVGRWALGNGPAFPGGRGY